MSGVYEQRADVMTCNSASSVADAIEVLLEEIEAKINSTNQAGAPDFALLNYNQARLRLGRGGSGLK